MTSPIEDRLARALDRLQSGGPAAVTQGGGRAHASPSTAKRGDVPPRTGDPEIQELLETAGYLRENLVGVPAPEAFRRELGDWLAQPRSEPWWRELMGPLRRRVPASARRPVLGAAIGLGAVAAIAVGVVAFRRRQAATASAS